MLSAHSFTFHNASIITLQQLLLTIPRKLLHSIMFLLQHAGRYKFAMLTN